MVLSWAGQWAGSSREIMPPVCTYAADRSYVLQTAFGRGSSSPMAEGSFMMAVRSGAEHLALDGYSLTSAEVNGASRRCQCRAMCDGDHFPGYV